MVVSRQLPLLLLNQPTLTAAMGLPTNILCNGGNNGSATVTAGGGTVLYTYSWAPNGGANATGTTMHGRSLDRDCECYTMVGLTTASGPLLSLLCELQPWALLPTYYAMVGTGSVTESVRRRYCPRYIHGLQMVALQATGTGLTAGSYTVTITDADACNATASVTITQPNLLTVTANGPATDCSGALITLTALASGGTAPYLYNESPRRR